MVKPVNAPDALSGAVTEKRIVGKARLSRPC